jgi:hypothetical protein
MSEIKLLVAALEAVRAECPYVVKDLQVGQGSRGYKAVGIEGMLTKLQPALISHGVITIPEKMEVLSDDTYETRSGSSMRRVVMRITYAIVHSSGQSVGAVGVGEAADSGDKATPKAITGAYKSMLRQLFSIESVANDPDTRHSDDFSRVVQAESRSAIVDKVLSFIKKADSLEKMEKARVWAKEQKSKHGLSMDEWGEILEAMTTQTDILNQEIAHA